MFSKLRGKLTPEPVTVEPPQIVAARQKLDYDALAADARARYQAAYAEVRWLEHAPPPREELQAAVDGVVAAAAADWTAANSARVIAALNPFRDPVAPMFGATTNLTFGFLAASDPDAARVALTRVLAQVEYIEGPAIADHATALEAARRALAIAGGDLAEAEARRSDEFDRVHGRENSGRVRAPVMDDGRISVPILPTPAANQVTVRLNRSGAVIHDEAR
jgi:hypothetical protein